MPRFTADAADEIRYKSKLRDPYRFKNNIDIKLTKSRREMPQRGGIE